MSLAPQSTLVECCRICDRYRQDDIARCLRVSLASVLSAALADSEVSFEYLRGVLSLARRQAALYGIPWCDLMASLHDAPGLWDLVSTLQGKCRHR